MNREKSLLKNTAIITIGKVCTQMITFLLLPVYTGLLSTKDFGIVDLLNTLVSLLLPIVTLQYDQSIFRELLENRNNKEESDKIITNGILMITFQCIIYFVIYLFLRQIIKNDYKNFLVVNVIIAIYLSLFQQIARGLGNNKDYSVCSFISALFTIIFNIIFLVLFKMGAVGMLLGTILGQLIGIIYLFIKMKIIFRLKLNTFDKKMTKKLLLYCIPLVPNAISWWIFSVSDRVIVTAILGVDQNGILAASLKFSTVYITLYNIFNISWTESVSVAINDEDIEKYFNNIINIVLKMFISIAMVLIAVIPLVFNFMINERYHIGYNLIPISIIASVFNVIVGLISVVYVAKKNSKAIANTSIISAIINLIVHLLLISRVGLYAAVISTFVSYFVMTIYRIIDIKRKYFKIKLDKITILYGVCGITLASIIFWINSFTLNLLSIFITIIISIILNKETIKIIKNYLMRKKSGVL